MCIYLDCGVIDHKNLKTLGLSNEAGNYDP